MRFTAKLTAPRPLSSVRAGSAIRRLGQRLVIVQDDVNALGLLDEASGLVAPLPLPGGGSTLVGKARKMDLEACATLPDGRLVALGSGSGPARERIVVVGADLGARVVDGRDLYAHLRSTSDFAGPELNIEGAVVARGRLRLFQRGNGAPRDGLEPVNAVGDLAVDDFVAWLDGGPRPALERVLQVDLGAVRGVRYGFTDATLLPDGRIAFIASAEDSPDAYHDGDVVGCRFGVLDGDAVHAVDVLGEDGAPTGLKLEGIDWTRQRDDGTWEFVVVADMDDPDVPATLATLYVSSQPRFAPVSA